jgi:PAS domain-containing protein
VQPKTISEWIALIGTISGIVVACYWFIKRTIAKFFLLCRVANQPWRELFGDNFVQELRDLINDLASAQSLHEIRHDIIYRQLGIGLYICDAASGECIYASNYLASEIFGVAPSQMLGHGWTAQIIDREEKVHTWEYCCKRKISYRNNYSIRNAATGKMVHCITEAQYVPIDGGRYVGFVKVVIR